MRKSKFTETQIVSILKQADAGMAVKDVCRQAGISVATYYPWKSKFGGMEASELKRVRELEEENNRLKRLYADLALWNAIAAATDQGEWLRWRGRFDTACRKPLERDRAPPVSASRVVDPASGRAESFKCDTALDAAYSPITCCAASRSFCRCRSICRSLSIAVSWLPGMKRTGSPGASWASRGRSARATWPMRG